MSDQGGTCSILLCLLKADLRSESQTEGAVIDLHGAAMLPLLPFLSRVYAYIFFTWQALSIVYGFPFPFASPRGVGRAMARLLHCNLIFTIIVQFFLSGMSGIMSHLASHAHMVVRNTHSITLAFCALPLPF